MFRNLSLIPYPCKRHMTKYDYNLTLQDPPLLCWKIYAHIFQSVLRLLLLTLIHPAPVFAGSQAISALYVSDYRLRLPGQHIVWNGHARSPDNGPDPCVQDHWYLFWIDWSGILRSIPWWWRLLLMDSLEFLILERFQIYSSFNSCIPSGWMEMIRCL